MNLKEFLTSTLDRMESRAELRELIGFDETLKRLRKRLNDDGFRIAVTGEFSSGKSTFINALLGRDILPHGSVETTAALSRLINVDASDERSGKGRAFFKDGSEVSIDDLSELKEFTTTHSTRYKVAEQIERVEIYVPILSDERSIAIVDTPGLNGIAEGHLEQTTAIVQEAHACIYILSRRGLTNTDVKFLNDFLVPYQRNFIFVQNFKDDFNPIEGETAEDLIEGAKKILREKVFGEGEYFFEICAVSSLYELVGRDETIERLYSTSTRALSSEDRAQLLEESGFDRLREILDRNFNRDELDKLKFMGMLSPTIGWCEQLLKAIDNRRQQAQEMYELSAAHRADERLDKLRERIIRSKPGDEEALKGFISRQCAELKKQLKATMTEATDALSGSIKKSIDDCKTLESLEQYGRELNGELRGKIYSIQTELGDYCNLKINEIYRLIIERLEEYGGSIKLDAGVSSLTLQLPKLEQEFVSSYRVDEINRQLSNLVGEQSSLNRQNSAAWDRVSRARSNLSSIRYRKQDADSARNRLGSRPQPTSHRESYEVKVERSGFFGSIWGFFAGPKTETRYRTVQDDSAGRQWDRDVQEAEARQDRMRGEMRAAERELNRIIDDAESYQYRIRKLEEKIERLRNDLRIEKNNVEETKRLARAKQLELSKKQLRGDVEKYFNGADGEAERLADQWSASIDRARDELQRKALTHFEAIFQKKLRGLEESRSGDGSELRARAAGFESAKAILEQTIEALKQKESELE